MVCSMLRKLRARDMRKQTSRVYLWPVLDAYSVILPLAVFLMVSGLASISEDKFNFVCFIRFFLYMTGLGLLVLCSQLSMVIGHEKFYERWGLFYKRSVAYDEIDVLILKEYIGLEERILSLKVYRGKPYRLYDEISQLDMYSIDKTINLLDQIGQTNGRLWPQINEIQAALMGRAHDKAA